MPQIGIQNASVNISFGKRKQRSQMCEIFTDDGRIISIEQEVAKGHMVDTNKELGFLIDGANQLLGKDNNWYQILGEKDCRPLPLVTGRAAEDKKGSDKDPLRTQIEQLFAETLEDAKFKQYMLARKNIMLEKLTQLVAVVLTAFLLYIVMQHFWGK